MVKKYKYKDIEPSIHPEANVCSEAIVIGDVKIEEGVSVWPGAVIRGDFSPVEIGKQSVIEDNTVIHGAEIGPQTIIGHGAVLNANPIVRDKVIVGINATINREATIGRRSIVASGAVIPEKRVIPSESFVRGVPAEISPLEDSSIDIEEVFDRYSVEGYSELVLQYGDLFR